MNEAQTDVAQTIIACMIAIGIASGNIPMLSVGIVFMILCFREQAKLACRLFLRRVGDVIRNGAN